MKEIRAIIKRLLNKKMSVLLPAMSASMFIAIFRGSISFTYYIGYILTCLYILLIIVCGKLRRLIISSRQYELYILWNKNFYLIVVVTL